MIHFQMRDFLIELKNFIIKKFRKFKKHEELNDVN